MIDNLIKALQRIEDNMTLKNDYSEEIEQIKTIKDSIEVLSHHQWNTPKWKIQDANKKADAIIEWIEAEMNSK